MISYAYAFPPLGRRLRHTPLTKKPARAKALLFSYRFTLSSGWGLRPCFSRKKVVAMPKISPSCSRVWQKRLTFVGIFILIRSVGYGLFLLLAVEELENSCPTHRKGKISHPLRNIHYLLRKTLLSPERSSQNWVYQSKSRNLSWHVSFEDLGDIYQSSQTSYCCSNAP